MNEKQPLISVIMPVKDGEKYLREAINSILKQTYTNFEFFIINDGSSDGTESIINSYTDPRIKVIKNKTNQGITKSLNKAIKEASGKYIARMDADDFAVAERFEKQIQYLENSNTCVALGTRYHLMDKTGNVYRKAYTPCSNHELKSMLLFSFPLCHPTLMIRHDIIKKHHILYNEKLFVAEDFEFLIRLATHGEIESLPDYLFHYRTHAAGTSKTKKDELVHNFVKISLQTINQQLKNHHIPQEELSEFVEIFNSHTILTNYCDIKSFNKTMAQLIDAYITTHKLNKRERRQVKMNCAEVLFKKTLIRDKNITRPKNLMRYIFDKNSLFFYFLLGIPQIISKACR